MLPHLHHGVRDVYQPVLHQLGPGVRAQLVESLGEVARIVRERRTTLHFIHVTDVHVLVSTMRMIPVVCFA